MSNLLDNSKVWSNIEFGEEITQALLIEVCYTHVTWSSVHCITRTFYKYILLHSQGRELIRGDNWQQLAAVVPG